ncbi:aminoglycoside phosphotransferase (APT) family kinase protein [Arcanobacterium wilhelmae]|uniref:Aminoglycoside phosphotransferase (APT) family kinase protein n=1 Tax=Arcanobacterium wilhelmae TaxID=1803177 RepID=A0ABT9NCP3_9ACTO|nr:phosphotransferase [Arcanobacterium wilhelmae]MDP9801490.1 aminoglycoside phosphotransferase (APT) family kinase protein [Arcanobacterium wilhelmae]WFN90821.1 phosphotransferase [Arcanobacterium wilhelmae]
MKTTPLHLAALAVAAIDGLEAVGTRAPYRKTPDFQFGGVVDARGRNWVVKVPLHTHAATTLEAEVSVAKALAEEVADGNLPFDILRPAGFAAVPTGRALVFPAPLGKPRRFDRLGEVASHELGRTLSAIHSLPIDVATRSGLPVYDSLLLRTRLRAELADINESSPLPPALMRRWEAAIANDSLWNFHTVFVHGDVAEENFFWGGGQVTTVMGFGDAHVGDPAEDFAGLITILNDDEFAAVIESYGHGLESDSSFMTRTILLSEIALARWLGFGVRTQDPDVIEDATSMLDDLAGEVAGDPLLATGPTWESEPVESDEFAAADEASFTSVTHNAEDEGELVELPTGDSSAPSLSVVETSDSPHLPTANLDEEDEQPAR